MSDRVKILGIGVDRVTMRETLDILQNFISEGKPKLVVTADAAGIVAAQTDEEWRRIMLEADLVTPDSVGVLWAANRAGKPISERVSGVELTEELIKRGCAIFFLGAAPEVAEHAKEKMLAKYPHAQIVGTRDGFFSEAEEAGVVGEIARARPQVLLVAMGIPRQEKFLRKYMNTIGASVNMGVGGTFDVLSGNVRRAPKLMQNLRLEWLWRLILNPKKWKKVASLPEFWWRVVSSRRGAVAD